MLEPNVAADTVLQVTNNVAFLTTIRVRGHTLSRNNYFNLNVRVCGSESISVTDATTRKFIFGFESGTPSSMSDATRYFTLAQGTF